MIIRNILDKTLDYKVDGKDLVLLPGLNLVDGFNETYLRNLMRSAFFLLEATYLEYTESLEAKNEVKVKNDIKEEVITTTTNEVTEEQPVLTEEIVKKAIKVVSKTPVKKVVKKK